MEGLEKQRHQVEGLNKSGNIIHEGGEVEVIDNDYTLNTQKMVTN